MATSPRPTPKPTAPESPRPALSLVPAPEADRRTFRVALVVSVALHVALLVLLAWFEHLAPPVAPAPPAPLVMRFVPALPPTEIVAPPLTENVSEHDTRAASPEERPTDERSPRVAGLEPEPVRPAPATPTVPPRPRPEPRPAEVTAPPVPDDEKIRRMEELLAQQRRIRPLGEMPDERLPALPWGGGPEGDIQFDSRADVDWGPYAARLRTIVRANWRIPTAAQVGMDGIVQVHFGIRRDGGIEELSIVRESGTVSLDVAANDAIALSDKLPPPPLPADGPEDQVGVTWTFFYNVDEREYRLWRREQRLRARRY